MCQSLLPCCCRVPKQTAACVLNPTTYDPGGPSHSEPGFVAAVAARKFHELADSATSPCSSAMPPCRCRLSETFRMRSKQLDRQRTISSYFLREQIFFRFHFLPRNRALPLLRLRFED